MVNCSGREFEAQENIREMEPKRPKDKYARLDRDGTRAFPRRIDCGTYVTSTQLKIYAQVGWAAPIQLCDFRCISNTLR